MAAISTLAGCSNTDESTPRTNTLSLDARVRRIETSPEATVVAEDKKSLRWDLAKTAIIICDMWDDHWCDGAARRVAEMAGPMNDVVQKAREHGILIIHAPSSTVEFYEGTVQRKRAQDAPFAATPVPLSKTERWGTAWCWPDPAREPDMPIDDSDMGCDCETKCTIARPWTRQIETIEIEENDAISDNGQEVYNLLAERGIDNVMLMGVHLNMCVLGRPFGIRQMVKLGKNVVLVRDLTDTMYNHEKRPFVDHFSGTDLVVEHVEAYWCPTITSADLVGGQPFRFAANRRGEATENSEGFERIFDGKSLSGWRVIPSEQSSAWSVQNGTLVGSSDGTGSDLVWKDADLGDFELKLRYRFRTEGNSGIHVRGVLGASSSHRVKGYHADFGHVGVGRKVLGAWDFHGAPRGDYLVGRGQRVVIDASGEKRFTDVDGALTPEDVNERGWNDVLVVARGERLYFTINGRIASEVIDDEPAKRIKRGVIGLQIHGGPPMTVEFREIQLKRLDPDATASTK